MASKKDIVEQALKLIFSGSKAVDEAGVPVRYYHGTTKDLPVIKPGTYFTEDPGEGSAYTFWTDLKNAEKHKGKYSVISAPELAGKRLEYFGTISDIDSPKVGEFYATDNGIMRYKGGGTWDVASDVGIDSGSLDMSDYTIGIKPYDNSEVAKEMVDEYEAAVKRVYPGGVGGNVIPAYLNVKNPKEMSPLEGNRFGERLGADPKWVADEIERLKAQGYDSIVTTSDDPFYAMEGRKPPKQYMIFEPTQVKSAIGNTGEYDFTNPDITKASGGSIREGYQTKGRVVGDIVDKALKMVMGEGEDAAKAGIRAYHASPHDFDKFEWSPRTFGTGEGAQSYGAGLYFAESPLVSGRGGTYDQQFTRKLLELDKSGGDTRMNRLKIGDQPLTSYGVEYDPEFIEAVKSGNEFRYAQNRLDRWHELSGDEAYPYRDYALEKAQAWEKLLNDMHSGKSAYYPTKSRIYEVDINARPTQLLDWDAPIKEQSGEIQRAVGNLPVNRPLSNYSVIGEPVQIDPYPNAPPALKAKLVALDGGVPYTVSVRTPEGGIVKIKGATPEEALSNANEYAGKAVKDLMSRTGGDLVKSLERGDYSIPDRTAKLNATGSLYKEGIPGLRYLDAGSRSGNVADPTRNYVIWNDELIDLKKKYEHGGRIAKGPGGWVDDVVKMAGKVISGEGEDAAKAGIRAYHGSPHDFDRFDMSKIGTGEGAQAYGHGLYFAENEGIARSYRDTLSSHKFDYGNVQPDEEAVRGFSDRLADVERRKQSLVDDEGFISLDRSSDDLDALSAEEAKIRNMMVMDTINRNPHLQYGRMYEVEINADPDAFLDWDKPLSEQPEAVQRFANSLKDKSFLARRRLDDASAATGRDVWEKARNAFGVGNADAATKALADAGIPGIKYLDAGSRPTTKADSFARQFGSRDEALTAARQALASARGRDSIHWQDLVSELETPQTRNYVVFDDKLISIIRKYGIAGASAMLGYNLMEQLDPKQALAASMADQDYQASRPQRSMGGNNSISGALNVARGLYGDR